MDNNKGFTFIELLIVLTVVSVLTAISLAYYNNNNQTIILKSEADKIIDVFSLTRQKAMSSEKPTNCNLVSYSIQFNANTYTVNRNISGPPACVSPDFTYTYTLKSPVANSTPGNTVTLTPLTGSASPEFTIQLKYGTTSQCANISINSLETPSYQLVSCP